MWTQLLFCEKSFNKSTNVNETYFNVIIKDFGQGLKVWNDINL